MCVELIVTGAQDPDETRIVYPLHYTSYLNFTNRSDASLYCQVVVFHLADLVMCYHYGNETSASVMKNNYYNGTRCAVCSFDERGSCKAHFDGKEEWNVTQKKFGDCNENRFVILNITTVTDDDDGITIFCGCHINNQSMNVLAEFNVHVTNATNASTTFDWELFAVCGLAGLVLVFALTTSSILYMCYIKQSKQKMKTSRDKMIERHSKWLRNSCAREEDSGKNVIGWFLTCLKLHVTHSFCMLTLLAIPMFFMIRNIIPVSIIYIYIQCMYIFSLYIRYITI